MIVGIQSVAGLTWRDSTSSFFSLHRLQKYLVIWETLLVDLHTADTVRKSGSGQATLSMSIHDHHHHSVARPDFTVDTR